MFNLIAGVRPSSPVQTSRHLAISSQHLLVQARAHKTMGNLEEAQKSYRDAIEKAKLEHEENPGNSQAKKTFDAISNEFLTFLNELPLNGHPISLSVQEKNAQVKYLFEKALSTLGSLELPNKPSLFLVYAHDNPSYGKAEAAISRYLIDQLSQIRVNLYSDQTPMGQPSSRVAEGWKEDGKLEDILTSQLCLLPTRLRDNVEPVDKVVVCCSEVLEKYLDWPHYKAFHRELREAYRKDCEQKGTSAIREVVKTFSQGEEYKAGFHHVLTEMAFLQIRAEQLKKQHGIIPVSLTPKSSEQCLGSFIASTTVRMEDISRFEEQAKAGREVYLNQGQHVVLFKLIERLLVGSDEAQTFLNKFWQGYDKCVFRLNKESSTPGELEFTKLVDSIFGGIEKTLRDQLVLATLQQHKDRVEKLRLPNLSDLRRTLYQHYQRSNLSIQRVSGDKVSLADCYINLAIVESQAQREKDKKELERQTATFERLPSSERLETTNPNKLIALEKLFEAQKLRDGSERVPKRILIQGRAGIGKTTLCKKLVYEYHQNGLWQNQFESVLWVPLRQLKAHAPKRLEDLLCTQYFIAYESSQAQALSKVFYAHQNKTLFILDGLDEVVGELNEGRPLKGFLQTLLNQVYVVITSRPAGVDANLLGQLDLELETVGFSPANVQAYIEKFVPESNQAAIQQFIHRTPLIQGLVNIPIQLDALCYSWDRLPQNKEVTMAMLYEAMVDKLWRKDGVRLEKQDKGNILASNVIQISSKAKLEKLMADEIHYFGYLAFKGLEEGKIEFSLEELDQCQTELEDRFSGKELSFGFTTDLKKTSFLHTADAERSESDRYYHFLHLTFQEFFAAKFLVKHLEGHSKNVSISALGKAACANEALILSEEALHAFIAGCKYNPRYEIVWWMVAGLLKGVPLEDFFARLEQSPRDLIGGRHHQVIMGCLNEARNQLNKTTVSRLEAELVQGLCFELKYSRNNESQLGRQRAFPEHLLLINLDQPEGRKKKIIKTLGARQILSPEGNSALISACQDENKDVRSAAVSALEKQKTLSDAAVLALIGTFQDQDKDVRSAAARALEKQKTLSDDAVLALIGAFQHENRNVRDAAVSTLEKQETLSEAAVLALIGACQHENRNVRDAAVSALRCQSALSEAAVLDLISACQNENRSVRDAAVSALRCHSTLSEAAVLDLIGACQHENGNVRSAAASALRCQSTLSEAAVLALIGACQHENGNVRTAAVSALEKQKTLSDAAVLALIGAFQHENRNVRSAVAHALGSQSTLSDDAVQVLIGALQDQDEDVRSAAASALGNQSTLSDAAVLALIGAFQDQYQYEYVKYKATNALERQKTLSEAAVLALIGAFQHENRNVRSAAVSALGNQSTLSDAAVLALIGACQHENWNVRSAAVSALGDQSTLSDDAVQVLIGALQDQDEDVRSAAARALGDQSTLSDAAVLALIGALQDQEWRVRSAAARALEKQKTLSDAAVLALIGALQDQEWRVRPAAARALKKQKTLSEAAVLALISAYQDENSNVRPSAVSTLGYQSTLPEAAVQVLISALQDQDEDVRSAAASALGDQSTLSEAAVLALIGAFQDQDKDVRSAAASALEKQKTLSEAIVLALIGAFRHENRNVRDAVARALGNQSTLSDFAVQVLIGALQDQDEDVRSAAARALGNQSTLSDAAVLALIRAFQNQDKDVRSAAARALEKQKTLSDAAVLALIGAFQHENWNVRDAAVSALEKQKTLSDAAVLALIGACLHEDWNVRDAAARALEKQKTLSDDAVLALIGTCLHENGNVMPSAARALGTHLEVIYTLLPDLSPSQLESLYTGFLFNYSCEHIAPLYVQDHQLHFYTERGLGQTDQIEEGKINEIIQAFESVRKNLEITHIQGSISINAAAFSEEITNLDDISMQETQNLDWFEEFEAGLNGHVGLIDDEYDDGYFLESGSEFSSEEEKLTEDED